MTPHHYNELMLAGRNILLEFGSIALILLTIRAMFRSALIDCAPGYAFPTLSPKEQWASERMDPDNAEYWSDLESAFGEERAAWELGADGEASYFAAAFAAQLARPVSTPAGEI